MSAPSKAAVAAFYWYAVNRANEKPGKVSSITAKQCGIEDDEFAACIEHALISESVRSIWIELKPETLEAIQSSASCDAEAEESSDQERAELIWEIKELKKTVAELRANRFEGEVN